MELLYATRRNWRVIVLAAFPIVSFCGLFALAPIPQDLEYHKFADTLAVLGIPNFLNVLSNIPFLIVGLVGIRAVSKHITDQTRAAWLTLFVGMTLVSFGSSYYHLAPGNATLVWDRAPMTIGFMGLLVALVGEYVSPRFAKVALLPAVLLGMGSVMYWHLTDDLRFYAWIQLMPLCVVALLLLCFRSPYTHSSLLLVALSLYVLAKVFEHFDTAIYSTLRQFVSGHTLKHFCAAAGCYALASMVDRRRNYSNDPLIPSNSKATT